MRPPTLTERVIDCSGGDLISEESGLQRKLDALVTLLSQAARPRTIIFCNKIPTCRRVRGAALLSSPWIWSNERHARIPAGACSGLALGCTGRSAWAGAPGAQHHVPQQAPT